MYELVVVFLLEERVVGGIDVVESSRHREGLEDESHTLTVVAREGVRWDVIARCD